MKRVTAAVAALILVIPMILASCQSKAKNNDSEQAHILAVEQIKLLASYRDSVKLSKDSASILRLMTNMDNAVTKLNYKYAPDLYLLISESDNEQITKITSRVVELRDSILYRIAHPGAERDTLPPDSVGNDVKKPG